ncbi:MAG: hypothetical protein EXR72_08840 [Myxococcales bacterium]|nr:hypothetical protein [Myxococcales bacterium]
MNRRNRTILMAAGLALAASGGGRAAASREGASTFPKLFDDPAITAPEDAKARQAVEKLARECTYSMYSRIGPSPEVVERCDRAEKNAISRGPDAARAALVLLDRASTGMTVRWRLYDVVARAGDIALLAPLVAGLERAARPDAGPRSDDRHLIGTVLQRISYASVGERAPWVQGDGEVAPAEWRSWLDRNQGKARSQLLAERIGAARSQVAVPDLAAAFTGARFLAELPATQEEGRAALQGLLARPDLEPRQSNSIQHALDALPKADQAVAAKGTPRV